MTIGVAALTGARQGIAATMAISLPMAIAGRLGLMDEQPPERITDRATRADVDAAPPVRRAASVVSHLVFGAGAGSLYAVIDDRLQIPGPPVLRGVVFGLGVWAVSYKGWIPALGILPPPERDHRGRRWTMLAAHMVYGASLARRVSRSH